jgi:dTDP-4-amino-4,6-dideoxygalactose transaminase
MTMLEGSSDSIPLTRLDNHDPALMEELVATVARVASTGHFIGGAEVEAFESEFATYCETVEAVGVSSGTEALHLGLRALGIKPGDEVVVPANSFIATAEAVSLAGAVPRFADVDPETHLITAETVERVLDDRVRCVIAVHLYGRTVDLEPIAELARQRGLPLVEDACQAHGALYRGRRAGSFGVFGAFSFYPAKNLGAWGDAGALTTSDPEIADHVRLLRSHGERPRYNHRVVGTTGRLDALQAAILRVKLARLDDANDGRRRAAGLLREALDGAGVGLPAPVPDGEDHVYHQFVIEHPDRASLREHLERSGIASGIHYPIPIHRSEAYAALAGPEDAAPVATGLAERICSLPMYPALDAGTAERIATAVRQLSLAGRGP